MWVWEDGRGLEEEDRREEGKMGTEDLGEGRRGEEEEWVWEDGKVRE